MLRPQPGWLVALSAALLTGSAWLPWLPTSGGPAPAAVGGVFRLVAGEDLSGRGGRANAIGGVVGNLVLPERFGAGQLIVLLASTLMVAGAMSARGLSALLASIAALVISLVVVALTVVYYRLNVRGDIAAGYGLYVGAGLAVVAVMLSIWALVAALS